jgi:hypothetical protein
VIGTVRHVFLQRDRDVLVLSVTLNLTKVFVPTWMPLAPMTREALAAKTSKRLHLSSQQVLTTAWRHPRQTAYNPNAPSCEETTRIKPVAFVKLISPGKCLNCGIALNKLKASSHGAIFLARVYASLEVKHVGPESDLRHLLQQTQSKRKATFI